MRRATAFATVLAAGLLLAGCGGSAKTASTPRPALPATTPSATASATTQATTGQVLLDITGSSRHLRSTAFTTHGTWDIVWEAESEPDVVSGAFIAINIYDPDGQPVAETVMANIPAHSKKSDVAHMHYAGTVYLDIAAASSWHVKAVTT